jgi:hypothetical protein
MTEHLEIPETAFFVERKATFDVTREHAKIARK